MKARKIIGYCILSVPATVFGLLIVLAIYRMFTAPWSEIGGVAIAGCLFAGLIMLFAKAHDMISE